MPRLLISVIAVLGLPVLLPLLGGVVFYQTWARELGWRRPGLREGWYWRVWWFYGYHGLFQIDWWMKRRCRNA